MRYILLFLTILNLVSFAQCTLGIDVSQLFSTSIYQCIKKEEVKFCTVRAYHSYGGVDTNAVPGLKNAKEAGLETDIYMFPCNGKKTVKVQVDEMLAAIPADLYSAVWIDVEINPSPGCQWSKQDFTSNCKFLTEVAQELKSRGKKVGIYASTYMWQTIFGSKTACPGVASGIPIWYAHYDGNPSFSDWSPFGGWTQPTIKQYHGSINLCGANVDRSYKQ